MFIIASAPNKRSLGATNGLSQTTVSIARAIGPALSTSLFSYSVEKNLLKGYAVYVIFATLSCFALRLATRLPEKVWDWENSTPDSNFASTWYKDAVRGGSCLGAPFIDVLYYMKRPRLLHWSRFKHAITSTNLYGSTANVFDIILILTNRFFASYFNSKELWVVRFMHLVLNCTPGVDERYYNAIHVGKLSRQSSSQISKQFNSRCCRWLVWSRFDAVGSRSTRKVLSFVEYSNRSHGFESQ